MEEFLLITVAFVVICLYLYILYISYGKKKQNDDVLYNIKSSEDSIDTKKVEEEKIIETKTIHYIENNVETEEKINIVEDNGGILKIAKSDDGIIINIHDAALYDDSHNNIACLSTIGEVIGEYDSCINNNHLFILGRDGIGSQYYIDINNISNIEFCIYLEPHDINFLDEYYDYNEMERLNFVIYTINKTSFDKLDYAISELENVNNFIELIKKTNKNITITRKHKVFIKQSKYPTLQYNLVDRINIKFYGLSHNTIEIFMSDSAYYEINIDYSDITEFDIVNYDSDRLCININTKNNGKFELVFSDSVEANEFYKKLQNHLPKI